MPWRCEGRSRASAALFEYYLSECDTAQNFCPLCSTERPVSQQRLQLVLLVYNEAVMKITPRLENSSCRLARVVRQNRNVSSHFHSICEHEGSSSTIFQWSDLMQLIHITSKPHNHTSVRSNSVSTHFSSHSRLHVALNICHPE